MTSLIYKQHNYKKSAHHKNNLLAHRVRKTWKAWKYKNRLEKTRKTHQVGFVFGRCCRKKLNAILSQPRTEKCAKRKVKSQDSYQIARLIFTHLPLH